MGSHLASAVCDTLRMFRKIVPLFSASICHLYNGSDNVWCEESLGQVHSQMDSDNSDAVISHTVIKAPRVPVTGLCSAPTSFVQLT